jgi:hypothetical protein
MAADAGWFRSKIHHSTLLLLTGFTSKMKSDPTRFSLLLTDWLVHKGLQFQADNLSKGGVSRGYSLTRQAYEYAYTEITGYALSFMLDIARSGDAKDFDQPIEDAFHYLLETQRLTEGSVDAGAFCHSVDPASGEARHDYYSFDAAMCVQGLVDYYRVSGKSEALQAAIRAADWLIQRMQLPDGSFQALASAGAVKPEDADDPIFGDQGSLHGKHAIGLLKVWEASQDVRYRDAAKKACDWVIQLQNPDGSFKASTRSRQTVSHTHCYAIEGLLYAAHCLKDERCWTAARKGGEWLARKQDPNGSIHIAYNRSLFKLGRRVVELVRPRCVGDATAQALRIWLLLDARDSSDQYSVNCEKAARFLEEIQITDPADEKALGGIQYWPGHPTLFAWVSMFAHQARRWLGEESDHPFEKKIESLF